MGMKRHSCRGCRKTWCPVRCHKVKTTSKKRRTNRRRTKRRGTKRRMRGGT